MAVTAQERLKALAAKTGRTESAESRRRIKRLAQEVTRNSALLVDSAAIGLATAVDTEAALDAPVLNDETNLETLQKRFSRKWQEILDTPNANQNDTYVKGFADKHLEIEIRDHLAAGHSIGGYRLPEGYEAIVPQDPTHPVTDIIIRNQWGEELPGIQVKLTQRAAYLRDTLKGFDADRIDALVMTNADAPEIDDARVIASPFTRDDMLGQGDEYLDAATETGVEELAEEAAIDSVGVGSIQGLRIALKMAHNLTQGCKPTEGIDWGNEAFSLVVNQVATGAGNLAALAAGPAGPVAALATKTILHRSRNRLASATALEVAIARLPGSGAPNLTAFE